MIRIRIRLNKIGAFCFHEILAALAAPWNFFADVILARWVVYTGQYCLVWERGRRKDREIDWKGKEDKGPTFSFRNSASQTTITDHLLWNLFEKTIIQSTSY